MIQQTSLFDLPLSQSVQLHRGFIPSFLADQFLEDSLALPWKQNEILMFGKPLALPRLEYMVGDSTDMHYTYSGSVELHAKLWEPFLKDIRNEIQDLTGYKFQVCIGNLYRNGQDSIGYHADDEPSMGIRPAIASISLGASRTFRVKSKEKGAKSIAYELHHGDLILMEPGCQENFVHALPKTSKPCGDRVNWTFKPYQKS
jgi:alkylated DNA repair dioxygenase AlkB